MSNVELVDENLIDLQFQEAALRLAKRKARWNANRVLLTGVVNALVKCGVEPSFDTDYLQVSCAGDKHKLATVIRIFRISGFNSTAARPKKGDSSWCAWFKSPECTVDIWFNFTSSVCKQVKVGVKTVTVDVYETQCGDISTEEILVINQDFAEIELRVSAAIAQDDDIPF